jgi:hypothetical protein
MGELSLLLRDVRTQFAVMGNVVLVVLQFTSRCRRSCLHMCQIANALLDNQETDACCVLYYTHLVGLMKFDTSLSALTSDETQGGTNSRAQRAVRAGSINAIRHNFGESCYRDHVCLLSLSLRTLR